MTFVRLNHYVLVWQAHAIKKKQCVQDFKWFCQDQEVHYWGTWSGWSSNLSKRQHSPPRTGNAVTESRGKIMGSKTSTKWGRQPERKQELWAESKSLDAHEDSPKRKTSPIRKTRTSRINSDNWKGRPVRRTTTSIQYPLGGGLFVLGIVQRILYLIVTILLTDCPHLSDEGSPAGSDLLKFIQLVNSGARI